MKIKYIAIIVIIFENFCINAQKVINPDNKKEWKLVWKDNFNYKNRDKLLKTWTAQNGTNGHILCSRWEENIETGNGTVKLVNKKETRGGQDWTSASIWTKEKFQYGYFECRYKYASASATNNSFWLMTAQGDDPKQGKRFEIDINEGHYPNSVNTNIHNWTDIIVNVNGKKSHPTSSKSFFYGVDPVYTFQLETPVKTKMIRFSSKHEGRIHIGNINIYELNKTGYPKDPFSKIVPEQDNALVDLSKCKTTKVKYSGSYQNNDEKYGIQNITKEKPYLPWVSQENGKKWVEYEFDKEYIIGCVQFTNGWKSNDKWNNLLTNFIVEYWDGTKWLPIGTLNNENLVDLSKEYHTYGLEWDEHELIFYFDRKEIRREKNEFCFSPSPIWLSLAIISWHGAVTDQIDGTKMEVDYVKVFNKSK